MLNNPNPPLLIERGILFSQLYKNASGAVKIKIQKNREGTIEHMKIMRHIATIYIAIACVAIGMLSPNYVQNTIAEPYPTAFQIESNVQTDENAKASEDSETITPTPNENNPAQAKVDTDLVSILAGPDGVLDLADIFGGALMVIIVLGFGVVMMQMLGLLNGINRL